MIRGEKFSGITASASKSARALFKVAPVSCLRRHLSLSLYLSFLAAPCQSFSKQRIAPPGKLDDLTAPQASSFRRVKTLATHGRWSRSRKSTRHGVLNALFCLVRMEARTSHLVSTRTQTRNSSARLQNFEAPQVARSENIRGRKEGKKAARLVKPSRIHVSEKQAAFGGNK